MRFEIERGGQSESNARAYRLGERATCVAIPDRRRNSELPRFLASGLISVSEPPNGLTKSELKLVEIDRKR